ncbi:MAG: SUMF1/EgtB/PvdO family nonheme iron enzyme [Myxococcota bacterium]
MPTAHAPTDVFISYAHADVTVARRLEQALVARGLTVWRDNRLDASAGQLFADEIARQIEQARRVVVLWSTHSVVSPWVQAEAHRALTAGKLVPVRIEPCTLPLPHDLVQALDLPSGGTDADLDLLVARLQEAPGRDGLATYRQAVRSELDRLPPVFRRGTRDALIDALVEVECSPTEEPTLRPTLRELIDTEPHRWSVLGPPGSGKSTALRRLALDLLDDATRVPVFLRVAECEPGTSLSRRLTAQFPDDAPRLLEAFRQGRGVLLLDGYDEHTEPMTAQRAVARLVADAKGCPVILSSRSVGFTPPVAALEATVQLRPLDEAAQHTLLQRWVDEPGRVESALQAMRRHRRMRHVVDNPLLLTLVGLVMQEGGAVPERRWQLFQLAVDCLLRAAHRPEGRGMEAPVAAVQALGEVALATHGREDDATTLEALCRVWPADRWRSTVGTSAERFFGDIADVTGLLVPVGRDRLVQRYAFPHRSLREYLAAQALASQLRSGNDDALASMVGETAAWAEVLALTCGILGPGGADALVARIAKTGDQALVQRVVAEAEGLTAKTVFTVLGVQEGPEAWPARRDVLLDLPDLVGDARVELGLLWQFSRHTTHGADRYWIRALLLAMSRGEAGSPNSEPEVQEEARALAQRMLLDHRPAERDRLRAELDALWRPIPPGTFKMGSPPNERGRQVHELLHDVHILRGFEMLATPVTHAMYEAFDPEHVEARHAYTTAPPPVQDRHPAYRVSWFEAVAFADWLGARLPTEAEWEWACRAGTTTRYWSGPAADDVEPVAWHAPNSDGRTHVVGERRANPYGLHDTLGNVWEWCADLWDDDAYVTRAEVAQFPHDPAEPLDLSDLDDGEAPRVLRGGSWINAPRDVRSASRKPADPGERTRVVGFRLARYRP